MRSWLAGPRRGAGKTSAHVGKPVLARASCLGSFAYTQVECPCHYDIPHTNREGNCDPHLVPGRVSSRAVEWQEPTWSAGEGSSRECLSARAPAGARLLALMRTNGFGCLRNSFKRGMASRPPTPRRPRSSNQLSWPSRRPWAVLLASVQPARIFDPAPRLCRVRQSPSTLRSAHGSQRQRSVLHQVYCELSERGRRRIALRDPWLLKPLLHKAFPIWVQPTEQGYRLGEYRFGLSAHP